MKLEGIITAMVTPINNDQEINIEATKALVNRLIESGVNGLFILGTNGEFHALNKSEKIKFASVVIEETNKRVPVIVGTGSNSTKETVELSQYMERIGADAISVITPYFIPLTKNEIIRHYKTIANSINIPVIMYNMPKYTGMNLDPDTVAELAREPNIKGIKDSSGNFENLQAYINLTINEDFSVLSGSDSMILKALSAGAAGAVTAISNVLTNIIVAIYQNWVKGNLIEAEKAQNAIFDFRKVLKLGTVPSVLKKALELIGVNAGPPVLPVDQPAGEILEKIEKVLNEYQQRYGNFV